MEDNETTDKLKFLQRNADELGPVLGKAKQGVFSRIVEGEASDQEIEESVEDFETKIFIHQKNADECDPRPKRALVTIADPGAFGVIAPIIEGLQNDPRVGEVETLVHGVARESFTKTFGSDFDEIPNPTESVLADLGGRGLVNVAFATISAENGPESIALFGGKSVLGAQRLYLIRDGWGGMGSSFDDRNRSRNMDEIDGIFCPDDLSKQVVINTLPNYPKGRIHSFGTPTVDSVYSEDGVELQRLGREKLGLDEDTIAVFYGGGIQSEWIEKYGTDPQIEARTFSYVVEAIVDVARSNTDKKYALLVRPHPRDPEKDTVYHVSNFGLPTNLQIVPATSPTVSPSEALYASDVDLTIFSTETFKNILRGRPAVFLSLEGDEMGQGMTQRILGKDTYNQLATQEGVEFIRDKQDLIKLISGIERKISTKRPHEHESSVGQILDIALS